MHDCVHLVSLVVHLVSLVVLNPSCDSAPDDASLASLTCQVVAAALMSRKRRQAAGGRRSDRGSAGGRRDMRGWRCRAVRVARCLKLRDQRWTRRVMVAEFRADPQL